MKVKTDFITNSSSTGFIFMFKGNSKIMFYKNLVEHSDKFELVYDKSYGNKPPDIIKCNVWEIIETIDPYIRKDEGPDRDVWIMKGIEPIEGLLKKVINDHDYWKKEQEEHDQFYYKETYEEAQLMLIKVKEAVSKGFTHYFDIDFGNDGCISDSIGDVMDYEGRNIRIDDDELILITEQRR